MFGGGAKLKAGFTIATWTVPEPEQGQDTPKLNSIII